MTCPAPNSMMIPSQSPDQTTRYSLVSSNPLERLGQLVIANDQLIDNLTSSRARIVAALTYLDKPDCNDRFGAAHLERCRTRHSGILAQLRANRIEALHLLDTGESHQ